MIRIVYVSTADLSLTASDLDALLAQAQVRNLRQGITGLLAFNGRNFMQALEGKAEDVKDVMTSIGRDKRHTGVIVISQQPISRRSFPEWSMRLTHAQLAELPDKLLACNGLSPELLSNADPEVSRLFTNFKSLA